MNGTIKGALIFAGGFTLGLLGGYACATRILDKKYSDICDEEIASVKDAFERKADRIRSEMAAENNEAIKRDISGKLGRADSIMNETDEPEETKRSEENVKSGPRESKLIRTYAPESVKGDDDWKNRRDIIDADMFVNARDFDKISLEYYEEDEVLIEDGEVCDIGSTIGFDALDHFGETGEEDVVYVRNNRLSTCFEVTRNHGSWYAGDFETGPEDE